MLLFSLKGPVPEKCAFESTGPKITAKMKICVVVAVYCEVLKDDVLETLKTSKSVGLLVLYIYF